MALTFQPLTQIFAAEVRGLDLTIPLSRADVHAINAGMNEHAVLVFRNQPLTAQQQLILKRLVKRRGVALKR